MIDPFGGRASQKKNEEDVQRSEMSYVDGDQYDGFGDQETVDVTDVDVEKDNE